MNAVSSIAKAIEQGFKLIAQVMSGSERRKMEKAIEYGEKFIRHYEKTVRKVSRDKKLIKYADKFFKYN